MGCGFSKCSCEEKKLRNSTMDNTPTFNLPTKIMKCKVLKVYDGDTIWVSIFLNKQLVFFANPAASLEHAVVRKCQRRADEEVAATHAQQIIT